GSRGALHRAAGSLEWRQAAAPVTAT
ncbi:MAG TPA: dethiobiotin synthase, partial [Glutamicibacter sp.]|nr:dethiobiotin synthase [Glutamicibacter sp.]